MEHENKQENTFLGIPADFFICLFLVLLTLAVYWPVINYEFINFDDKTYVSDNFHIQNGLTSKSIAWSFSFSEKAETYWHPLTWISHILDCQIYGLNPGMHHLSSLIVHMLNSMLLFFVFKRMTGEVWKSAFVAILFALHPINVDSVAWVAERKNVLSTFFWILTMMSYAFYCEKRGLPRYLLTCLVFTLGLLAKPMLVTLPCVLLLMDYWPLGRIRQLSFSSISQKILEKVPLFILSGVSIFLSTLSLKGLDSIITMEHRPMALRIANATVSYVSYIGKTLWPHNLAVLYPYPGTIPSWKFACSGLFLIGVSILVVLVAKRRPYLSVGWLWFLGTLVPVLGLVQSGLWPAMADRWAYVPLIGLFIMVAWGIPDLFNNLQPIRKRIFIGIAGTLFFVIILVTWKQVQYWENSITLFRHAIAVTTDNDVAHTNLAQALLEKGKLNEAKRHLYAAIKINPNFEKAYGNLGFCLLVQHKPKQAIEHYQKALSLNPDFHEAANNLAWILATHKNPTIRNGKKAVELAEHVVEAFGSGSLKILDALDTLAAAYAETGQYKKATQIAEKALQRSKTFGNLLLAAEIQKRVLLYDSGMPFRE